MFSGKNICFILGFLFILVSCTRLPNNLLELDNSCDIDEDCELVLSGLGCCDSCGVVNVSTDIVIAVNSENYEIYREKWYSKNCGEVYGCPECAPGPWINYENFEVKCVNNICTKVEVRS